jgi:hypothetical protein
MVSPELVFLAIQAGVRLYAGLRTAYIASVREATITLPLPRAPGAADPAVIVDWFLHAAARHRPLPQSALEGLVAKGKTNPAALSADEKAELERAYSACWIEANPPMLAIGDSAIPQTGAPITGADYLVLAEVRQWAKGQPGAPPTGFQRVAGTLVEVAVFWFANQPGAISEKHPAGRALLSFLKGVEGVKFSEQAPVEILDQVLVGVLETVAAEPRLISGGRREEALISNVAKSVAGALDARFKTKRTATEEADAASWAQLVARAMLKAGAETVLADPSLFFGVDGGDESAIITDVGSAFVNLLVPTDPHDRDQLALKSLVSGAGLETLVRAALRAVGQHPGVLGLGADRKGLTALVADLAVTFSNADLPASAAAAFPEIAELVLARSATHLDEIWGGDRKDVGRNLLVLATRHTLQALAAVAGGSRDPLFAKQQVIELFDAVLAEVVENPRWVVTRIDAVEESAVLTAALEAALTALRGQKFTTLSGETRLGILKAALEAGGLQLALLREIPPGGQDAGKIALAAVIDAVFAELAHGDAEATWRLARSSAIVALFQVALGTLTAIPAGDPKMQARVDVLRGAVRRYAQGGVSLEELAGLLAGQLKVIG